MRALWRYVRFWLIEKLAGNATIMLNVDHNHDRIFVNVPGDLLLVRSNSITILPASDEAEKAMHAYLRTQFPGGGTGDADSMTIHN